MSCLAALNTVMLHYIELKLALMISEQANFQTCAPVPALSVKPSSQYDV